MKKYKVKTVIYSWMVPESKNDAYIEEVISSQAKEGYELKSVQPLIDGEQNVQETNEGPAAWAYSYTKGFVLFFEKDE